MLLPKNSVAFKELHYSDYTSLFTGKYVLLNIHKWPLRYIVELLLNCKTVLIADSLIVLMLLFITDAYNGERSGSVV